MSTDQYVILVLQGEVWNSILPYHIFLMCYYAVMHNNLLLCVWRKSQSKVLLDDCCSILLCAHLSNVCLNAPLCLYHLHCFIPCGRSIPCLKSWVFAFNEPSCLAHMILYVNITALYYEITCSRMKSFAGHKHYRQFSVACTGFGLMLYQNVPDDIKYPYIVWLWWST